MNKTELEQVRKALIRHTEQTRPIASTEEAIAVIDKALAQPAQPAQVSEHLKVVAIAGIAALCNMTEGYNDLQDLQIDIWRKWLVEQNAKCSETLGIGRAIFGAIAELEASFGTAQPTTGEVTGAEAKMQRQEELEKQKGAADVRN